jgi:uncharacterized protein (UPF0332 family)
MSFDWTKYLKIAEELSKREDDEACLRTAISRAYYAVWCFSRDKKGIIPKKFSSSQHQIVIEEYWISHNSIERQIGKLLAQLKKSREIADYETDISVDISQAKHSLFKANKIIQLFQKIQNLDT